VVGGGGGRAQKLVLYGTVGTFLLLNLQTK
jgi:hypothetical protein